MNIKFVLLKDHAKITNNYITAVYMHVVSAKKPVCNIAKPEKLSDIVYIGECSGFYYNKKSDYTIKPETNLFSRQREHLRGYKTINNAIKDSRIYEKIRKELGINKNNMFQFLDNLWLGIIPPPDDCEGFQYKTWSGFMEGKILWDFSNKHKDLVTGNLKQQERNKIEGSYSDDKRKEIQETLDTTITLNNFM